MHGPYALGHLIVPTEKGSPVYCCLEAQGHLTVPTEKGPSAGFLEAKQGDGGCVAP